MTRRTVGGFAIGSSSLHGTPWVRIALAGMGLLVVAVIGIALAPYVFHGATLESEMARQVRATTGLSLRFDRPARFSLWPRPHVSTAALHISDPTGTLSIDAAALEGDVRLLPLIVGRIELSSVTLAQPRLGIDLDGREMPPDSLLGRALHNEETGGAEGSQRLGIITLVDGTATITSKAFPNTPTFKRIDVTLDWRDLESPATLTGSLLVRDTAADIAAWIAQPSNLMRGEHSAVAFHLRGAPLDLSASGDAMTASASTFRGHMSAKTPSMADLLALVGGTTTLAAPFANSVLDSDVGITVDPQHNVAVDLSKLVLRADGNDYEGTLAIQNGTIPSISGTLATEQLNVAPFLSGLPAPIDAHRHWSATPLRPRGTQPLDLDLRVSATHLRAAPFTIDDAALSIMTRSNRTEIALVEGKAYSGTLKGRLSIGRSGEKLNLRGIGSMADADASAFGWDAVGRQVAMGSLAISATLESTGDTTAALMKRLHGSVKGRFGDGEITGTDIARALRSIGPNNGKNGADGSVRSEALWAALKSGRTPFSSLTFAAEVDDGVAVVDESTLKGADATMAIGGSVDLGGRSFDLKTVASAPGAPATDPRLQLNIGGSFDRPSLTRK